MVLYWNSMWKGSNSKICCNASKRAPTAESAATARSDLSTCPNSIAYGHSGLWEVHQGVLKPKECSASVWACASESQYSCQETLRRRFDFVVYIFEYFIEVFFFFTSFFSKRTYSDQKPARGGRNSAKRPVRASLLYSQLFTWSIKPLYNSPRRSFWFILTQLSRWPSNLIHASIIYCCVNFTDARIVQNDARTESLFT